MLEKHHFPGGCTNNFVRGDYRFEASTHVINGCEPGGMTYRLLEQVGAQVTIVNNGREAVETLTSGPPRPFDASTRSATSPRTSESSGRAPSTPAPGRAAGGVSATPSIT